MWDKQQQTHYYVAPNLEYEHDAGKESAIQVNEENSKNDTDIGAGVDDETNTEIFDKFTIEFKKHS